MSAIAYTDWAVLCNGQDGGQACVAQERTDILELGTDATAADVRKILKRWGWAVSVAGPVGSRRRLDYCPKHKPGGGS